MPLMLRAFASAGYDVTWHLLNARGWVPQSRKRLYFVGFRRDLRVPPFAPTAPTLFGSGCTLMAGPRRASVTTARSVALAVRASRLT